MLNKNKEKGQSIIEVIIALTLIVFILGGIIAVQIISQRNLDYSRRKSQAVSFANQQLERARVIRDIAGITELTASCTLSSPCFINAELTPVAVTPTGIFGQSLSVIEDSEGKCPVYVTPPVPSYKMTSVVGWDINNDPNNLRSKEARIESCLTDWRE